jgi:hypothetical protein
MTVTAGDCRELARLPELAARYAAVTELPDDVAALRQLVGDQAVSMAKLLVLVDRLEARVARLEARQRGAS